MGSFLVDDLKIDFDKVIDDVVEFIQETVRDKDVLIGLSGGLDSSVTAVLLVKALNPKKVHGLIMPTSFTPTEDVEDAKWLAEYLKIDYKLIQIDSIVKSYAESVELSLDDPKYKMSFGNLRARIRMSLLYFYANITDGLVAGTGDKSEILIGYYTKYGDGGVDFLPIAHLYKTQLRELGAYLGLPKRIYSKPAAPRLYPGHVAIDEIPVDYSKLDLLLYNIFDRGLGIVEASERAGLPVDIAVWVSKRYHSTEHKRKMPPSLLKIKYTPPIV
ncbi:MAG: NAD+ synthase [Aigarchaeota archaeon]|nr:NAD+ synthase [Aigarchaeota archaeon]MDW7985725.1 NAD+ synthase [Nitrososphaerota archaeon]